MNRVKFGASEIAQSCLTLCDPMDCILVGFSIHGIFQARVLEWVNSRIQHPKSYFLNFTKVSPPPETYHGLTTHHSKERLVKMNFSLNFPSRTTKVEFSPIFGFSQNRNRAQAINSHRFSYSISSPTSDSIKIYTALISFVKKHTEPLRFFPQNSIIVT